MVQQVVFEVNVNLFIKFHKQYRKDDINPLVVCKLWNKGMGRMPLIRFYPEKEIILVNKCLFNKFDEKHLTKFIEAQNIQGWTIVYKEYGYMDTIKHSFAL